MSVMSPERQLGRSNQLLSRPPSTPTPQWAESLGLDILSGQMWIWVLILSSSFPLRSKSFKSFFWLPEEGKHMRWSGGRGSLLPAAIPNSPVPAPDTSPALPRQWALQQWCPSMLRAGSLDYTRPSCGRKQTCSLPSEDQGPRASVLLLPEHRPSPSSSTQESTHPIKFLLVTDSLDAITNTNDNPGVSAR